MERPSQNAANFVRKLADLTYRLAAKDIVISKLHADWAGFGCWELQAQSGEAAMRYRQDLLDSNPKKAMGPEVVRLFWDGRDKFLSIEASPTRWLSAPNQWERECAKAFDSPEDDLFGFVEEYLTTRLAPH